MSKQLVSFGNHLLRHHGIKGNAPSGYQEVTHANIENWYNETGENKSSLPSAHQIKDFVSVVFGDIVLPNCRIECVRFKEGTVYYDVSVKMMSKHWDKPMFTNIKGIHSAFVTKKDNVNELLGTEKRPHTVRELQAILYKMDYYKDTEGFICVATEGGTPDFSKEKLSFGTCEPVTREDVLRMIDEAE